MQIRSSRNRGSFLVPKNSNIHRGSGKKPSCPLRIFMGKQTNYEEFRELLLPNLYQESYARKILGTSQAAYPRLSLRTPFGTASAH